MSFDRSAFRSLTQAVIATEKPGTWGDWSKESQRLYEAGNWKAFSRSRGYSETEISLYAAWLRMIRDAIDEDINPLIFISDLAWGALQRNLQQDPSRSIERYLHKP